MIRRMNRVLSALMLLAAWPVLLAGAEAGMTAKEMADLADQYYNGDGVEQSDEQAVYWYRQAADLGDAYAMAKLGWMYRNGRGVEQSDEEAVRWYRPAAELGNADAMTNLGWMYRNGRGVEQSDEEAVSW